jgi:hypothetical protein
MSGDGLERFLPRGQVTALPADDDPELDLPVIDVPD